MASAKRLPTTYNISTYGSAGRDYTSLATWEAATDIDLVTATNGEVLECYDDAATFEDTVTIAGATTNINYFRVIKPASGQKHDGTPNNGFTFLCNYTLAQNTFLFIEEYSGIYDIVFQATGGRAQNSAAIRLESNYGKVAGCVFDSLTNSGGGLAIGVIVDNVETYVVNNIFIDIAGWGVAQVIGGTTYCYNNTIVGCVYAYERLAGSIVVTNGITEGNSWSYKGINITVTFSTENDGVIFVDSGNKDYHLDSTDTVARGTGTDLSADGTYAFDDDIDDETRSAWDIGADEYSTGGASNPDAPTTPSPINGGTGEGEDQTLTCVVTDPSSLPMDVSFYNGADDSLIGTDSGVASGGIATIVWEGLTPSTLYTWYAIADNGSGTAQSVDWTFTAGTRSWKWYMSQDNTLREYVDGVKITQISITGVEIAGNVTASGTVKAVTFEDNKRDLLRYNLLLS